MATQGNTKMLRVVVDTMLCYDHKINSPTVINFTQSSNNAFIYGPTRADNLPDQHILTLTFFIPSSRSVLQYNSLQPSVPSILTSMSLLISQQLIQPT